MNLHVVLVRSEHSGNVGATARAMANMGAQRLILIDPRCKVDSKARANAAGAEDQLSYVTMYPDWTAFYATEGDGVRIALSRRAGQKRRVTSLKKELGKISESACEHLYLIFGPESDGLNAEDLSLVNFVCHLPVYGEFASLNLAQAVMLSLFMVREQYATGEAAPKQFTGKVAKPAQAFYFPDQQIKEWLEAMGFDVGARKASAYLTLRRLFLQNQPTQHELHVLEAILRQNIRKLQKGGAEAPNSLSLPLEELADDLGDVTRQ
jgi:TrmH family RNA methyltransferase